MSTEGQDQEVAGRLREIRQRVRARAAAGFKGLNRPVADADLLYGDRDAQLFPQLRHHLQEVESLAHVQEQPFQSRLPVVGRLIAWFRDRFNRISTRWYVLPLLQQQVHFNMAVVRALQDLQHVYRASSYDLVRRMDALFYPLDQEQLALHAWLGDLQAALVESTDRLQASLEERAGAFQTALEERSGEFQAALGQFLGFIKNAESEARTRDAEVENRLIERLQALRHEQELAQRRLSFLRLKLDRLMGRLAGSGELSSVEQPAVEAERQDLEEFDYYIFEDLYRREEAVRQQQEVYLPLFEGHENVLDIGCGKGEFLELLRDHGVPAYGLDLNEQMVRVGQEKGLRVVQGDALTHLAGLPDDSLGGLFGAHLVEHLAPRQLVDLVRLAQAKLRPGAYLAFETPNPLCLWALVNYFYLDMSHVKPVHPQALAFVLEMHGFRNVEIRYLHPVPEGVRLVPLPEAAGTPWEPLAGLINANVQRLNDLLYGYADYAIVAQK